MLFLSEFDCYLVIFDLQFSLGSLSGFFVLNLFDSEIRRALRLASILIPECVKKSVMRFTSMCFTILVMFVNSVYLEYRSMVHSGNLSSLKWHLVFSG